MTEISATLLLPVDGSGREFGTDFVNLLRQVGSNIAPMKCNSTEPVNTSCSGMSTEEIASNYWGKRGGFLWTGAKSRMHGIFEVFRGETDVFIYGKFSDETIGECTRLFREVAIKWPIDFGCIHVFGDKEFERYRTAFNRLLAPFNRGMTYADLATGIPNLGWITIFGRPYVSKIDRSLVARVASSMWTPSEQTADPLFVQLTREPRDVLTDFDQFDGLRQRARAAIGDDLFKGPEHDARWVPEKLRLPPIKSVFTDLDELNRISRG
jgi:hypothetical protein